MATGGAGWLYGKELKNYLEELVHFRKIIEQIKGEMQYASVPLPEIFHRIAKREKEPYGNWLMELTLRCQSAEDKRFAELWRETTEKDLTELQPKGRMDPLINEPGELLEIGDRDSVIRLLEYYLKRMDREIDKKTTESDQKKKIGSWLGVAGGVFLVILLL